MTRRRPLRLLLQNTISHGALDFAGYPVMFRLGIDAAYKASCEAVPMGGDKPLSFLARVQMWLLLALGLESVPDNTRSDFIKFNVPRIHHKQVNLKNLRKSPAHNLEALMRFAPDAAGRGLTLNQYRERFTRLSVIGRARIYSYFMSYCMGRKSRIRRRLRLRRAIGFGRDVRCGAPLSPD